MPRRTDIHSILVIGAGPIVIGQGCEFDYSGTQAIKALRAEGYRIILVNSNPATIMTDPELADATYIEPITPEIVAKVIEAERPDALLPTMGGQTALNVSLALFRDGTLARYGVEMIGANADAIDKAEDRQRFKEAMAEIGLESPRSGIAHSVEEALAVLARIGLPSVIRPSFTLGGTGGGIAYNKDEFEQIVRGGLAASPTTEVLIEESLVGWKEYEMEVVRDRADNAIIVCGIENVDPMGVHTGDSITCAPILTLTDKEYQRMRNASIACLRAIGVETGGSNVQFAVDPKTGRMLVIEMNPRVSRSSALASKATGFPIAKVAALLAVGYTLDEIPNDITKVTPASFEPTIDYVVVKIPRFAFEKFPGASDTLGTSMKSVGEVMAIGRCFAEALQKALRGLETGLTGLDEVTALAGVSEGEMEAALSRAHPLRLLAAAQALRNGMGINEIHRLSGFDPWFLGQLEEIVLAEAEIAHFGMPGISASDPTLSPPPCGESLGGGAMPGAVHDADERAPTQPSPQGGGLGIAAASWSDHGRADLLRLKALGFSDARLAALAGSTEGAIRARRHSLGIRPVYKRIDTCAAEFEALTPYMYSTYETPAFGPPENECQPTGASKIVILGGGPNRIGQGIEFDYCCCHAAFALRDAGYETIMVNCNPETVSTDPDTSDRLYFEPLTAEDVLEIFHAEAQAGTIKGVIVQLGGQTPLKLAHALEAASIPILGTLPDAIDAAEDRERFADVVNRLGLKQPANGLARSADEAVAVAARVGYPVLLRPSYVLGGRGMELVHSEAGVRAYITEAVRVSGNAPVLVDHYLRDATEVDVDAVADGTGAVFVAGVLQHIEEAGVHSGDSACSIPPWSLPPAIVAEIERQSAELAHALNVVGLMNAQFAVKNGEVYLIEVNPRASRTVPFTAKATGIPLARIAARLMAGERLAAFDLHRPAPTLFAVKESIFPFARFPGTDPVLGPEMKSTGEVMGLAHDFATAFAKSQLGVGTRLPMDGAVFLSVKATDKPQITQAARDLAAMGFTLLATDGTAAHLDAHAIPVTRMNKVAQGRPHIVDRIKDGAVALVVNTTEGVQSMRDSQPIRAAAVANRVPYFTTAAASVAAVQAIAALKARPLEVGSLQAYHLALRN